MNMDAGVLVAIVIPILIIQVGLIIVALHDLTRPTRRVRGGSKVIWALIIILINIAGPVLYFLLGREDA